MQWSFLSVDCRISGFNFLKVKLGVFIDICLFLESSVSPKAPCLLTVPLPSLTSPHPAWGTEPCVSLQGPSAPGTGAALQLHTALPCLPRAGAALVSPRCPLLVGDGMGPGTRLSLGTHSALTWPYCSSLQGIFNFSLLFIIFLEVLCCMKC